MVSFRESAHVRADPAAAWRTAADLSRLGEWMSMHEGWRGELPTELAEGVTLTSVVTVKGLRNRITWHITSYDPPQRLVLEGKGVGGTAVSLALGIKPDGAAAKIEFDVDFSGKLVFGPIGMTVKRALKGDVHKSIERLTELIS